MFIRGGITRARIFWWPLQHESSFIFRFRQKSRTKWLPADLSTEGLVLLGRHARFLSYMSILCDGRGTFGTFWGLKRRWRDKCRTSYTFSSAWQGWHLLHVAKTLPGVGQNERWFWRSCCLAGAIFTWWTWSTFWKGEKSCFVKLTNFDFGQDDDSVWQVQNFGCLGLIFCGRRSTL